jgi:hypothetical protein
MIIQKKWFLTVMLSSCLISSCNSEKKSDANANAQDSTAPIYLPFDSAAAAKAVVPEKLEQLGVAQSDSVTQAFFMKLENEHAVTTAKRNGKNQLIVSFDKFFDSVPPQVLQEKAKQIAELYATFSNTDSVRCVVLRQNKELTYAVYKR